MAKRRSSEFEPAIRRVRYPELTLFEITEEELELLERGSPDSVYLNLAAILLSAAASFLASLLTADFSAAERTFIVYVVITVVGFIAGVVLLAMWYFSRRSVSGILRRIRDRAQQEGGAGIPAPLDAPRSRAGGGTPSAEDS